MAHNVHDFVQFYDVNLHSQRAEVDRQTNPALFSCQCDRMQFCQWQNFFNLVFTNPGAAYTPYRPDLFAIQEVGVFSTPQDRKYHVPCDQIQANLNGQPGQAGATWGYRCTDTYGSCAVFYRNDATGFQIIDDFQIPLPDTPNFKIQAVKLKTRVGDRNVGVASVHTNPDAPNADNARNQAYTQMLSRWGDIHLIVAGDFNNQDGLNGQSGLEKVYFPENTSPGCNRKIDHVFLHRMTSAGLRPGNQTVVVQTNPAYSDHRGLGVCLYW